jgi:hypothetical protein
MKHISTSLISAAFAASATVLTAAYLPVAAQAAPPQSHAVPGQIVIKTPLTLSEAQVKEMADKAGCQVVGPIAYSPGYYLLETKGSAASRGMKITRVEDAPRPTEAVLKAVIDLRANQNVLADPNYLHSWDGGRIKAKRRRQVSALPSFTPDDPRFGEQWDMRMINVPQAYLLQFQARQVIAAVLDSGWDNGHPDFEFNGVRNYLDSLNFSNPTAPDTNVIDNFGHGVHVAGTVAAYTHNGVGVASVAGYKGNGVNVQLLPLKLGDAPSVASGIAALNYAVSLGAVTANMSYGSYAFSDTENASIQDAFNSGLVCVGAAGNDALDNTQFPHYPSNYDNVISVSSVGPDRKLASYSNFSGTVAIAAPGGDAADGSPSTSLILSTYGRNFNTGGYEYLQGTSMAAPHVAGAVAILMAAGVSHLNVKQQMQDHAQVLDETPNPAGGNQYGAGLLDLAASLLPVSDPPFAATLSEPTDQGVFYFQQLPETTINMIGVSKFVTGTNSVTVEVRTATFPSSTIRTYSVNVPSLSPGEMKATQKTVTIGGPSDPKQVPVGRFKEVLLVNGVEVGSSFFEIQARTQQLGRTMFAVPFRIPTGDANPEQSLLGPNTTYSLARYNPLRLPSDFDYALYQSAQGGRKDSAARFEVRASDSSALTYEIASPTVSVAPVGLGYWLNLDRAVTLNTAGFDVVTSPVAVRLFAQNGGWNMVGAPFIVPASWGNATILVNGTSLQMDEAIAQNIISPALIGRNQEDYQYTLYPFGELAPFSAYWVRVYQDCTLILGPRGTITRSVPTGKTATSRATVSKDGRTLSPDAGWRARLVASVGGDKDGQNYFGQVRGSSDDLDMNDIPKPPSGAGHAYVRFIQQGKGTNRGQSLAYDMRSPGTASKTEWIAAVSTDRSDSDVTLTWDGLGNAPSRSLLTLTDMQTGRSVSLRDRSSYSYRSGEAGATRQFKITMTQEASAGPLQINNLSVVGSSRGTTGYAVRFNTTRDAEVTGVVKTISGKVVANLSGATRATSGASTTMRWTGRAQDGSALPSGPYVLEITARDDNGKATKVTRPIQNLR